MCSIQLYSNLNTYISSIVRSGFQRISEGKEILLIPQNWSGSQEMYSLFHLWWESKGKQYNQLEQRDGLRAKDKKREVFFSKHACFLCMLRSYCDSPHIRNKFLVFFNLEKIRLEVKSQPKAKSFKTQHKSVTVLSINLVTNRKLFQWNSSNDF